MLAILQIEYHQYISWKNKRNCHQFLFNRCWVKYPTQLLPKEISLIREYLLKPDFKLWPAVSVYQQMRRDGVGNFYQNTFYKYVKALRLQRILPQHRRKNHCTGMSSDVPLTLLHMDVTKFTCKNGTKTFMYVVKDNFTKAVHYARASLELKAEHVKTALQTVYEKHLKELAHPVKIMSDGGSENTGIRDWLSQTDSLKMSHIVAQVDVQYSNSMVEAANRMLKYYGLYQKEIADFESLQPALEIIVTDYNHRPNHSLKGLTPYEALAGKTPGKVFSAIKPVVTPEQSILENRQFLCCNLPPITKK